MPYPAADYVHLHTGPFCQSRNGQTDSMPEIPNRGSASIRKIQEVLYVERISLLETNNASTMDAILNNASTMELYTVALYNR